MANESIANSLANSSDMHDISYQDQVIKALEHQSDALASMSGTEAGIAAALQDVTDMQVSIDDKLIAINSSLEQWFALYGDNTEAAIREQTNTLMPVIQDAVDMLFGIDDRMLAQERSLSNQSASGNDVATISAALPALQTTLDNIDSKVGEFHVDWKKLDKNQEAANAKSFIEAALNLCKFVATSKNAKNFEKNSKAFAAGIDVMMKPVKSIITVYAEAKNAADAFNSTIDLFDEVGKSAGRVGKAVVRVVGATIAMVATIALLDWATLGKFMVTFPLLCSTMALGLLVLGKAGDKHNMENVHHFCIGITALAIGLIAFQFIDWQGIAKGVVGMTGLAAGLALALKILPGKKLGEFGKNVLLFAVGVAILSATMVALSAVIDKMPFGQLMKGAAIMIIASGLLWLASKILVKSADNIGKAFAWCALGLVVFGLSLLAFQEVIKEVDWDTWLYAGGTLLAIAGVAWLIGKSQMTWQGVAGIVAIVGALYAVAKIAPLYEAISWDTMAKMGAVGGYLVAAVWLAGKASKQVLLGVGAMIACAGAVFAIGYALKQWPDKDWEDLAKVAVVIGGLAVEFGLAGIGPIPAAIALGAGAMIIAGGAVLAIAKALDAWPDKNWEDLAKVAVVIAGLAVEFGLAGVASPFIAAGASALGLAGGAIWAISKGLTKWPTKITDAQYTTMAFAIGKLGLAMAAIGNPLTYPFMLIGIGAAAGLGNAIYKVGQGLYLAQKIDFPRATKSAEAIVKWAKSTLKIIKASLKDVLQGPTYLRPFEQLGRALATLSISVMTMANGTWKEYDNEGKVIAIHRIGPEQYAMFGDAVAQLLNSITEPLQKFGAGGGFLRSSDAEKGMDALKHIDDITGPMIDVAKSVEDLYKTGTAGYKLFGECVASLIKEIKVPVESIGKDSSWLSNSDFESGLKVMKQLKEALQPMFDIANNSEKLFKTDFKLFGANMGAFLNVMNPIMVNAKNNEDNYDDGADALAELSRIVKPMTELAKVADTYKKYTPEDNTAIRNIISTMTTSVATLSKADASLPLFSKLALHLRTINSAFNNLDEQNLQLIVDAAQAIDHIANANLGHIAAAKSEVAQQLFEQLLSIREQLEQINANTRPKRARLNQTLASQLNSAGWSFGNTSVNNEWTSDDTMQAILWRLFSIDMNVNTLTTASMFGDNLEGGLTFGNQRRNTIGLIF